MHLEPGRGGVPPGAEAPGEDAGKSALLGGAHGIAGSTTELLRGRAARQGAQPCGALWQYRAHLPVGLRTCQISGHHEVMTRPHPPSQDSGCEWGSRGVGDAPPPHLTIRNRTPSFERRRHCFQPSPTPKRFATQFPHCSRFGLPIAAYQFSPRAVIACSGGTSSVGSCLRKCPAGARWTFGRTEHRRRSRSRDQGWVVRELWRALWAFRDS